MPRIIHVADVHLRALQRHDEYRTVFEALIQDCKPKLQRLINNQHTGAWTYESEMNLLKMYNEGKSYEEIANTLNRSVSAIVVKNARLRKKFNLTGGTRRQKNQHMSKFKWDKR
jgi:DNA-binding NarL/FixJ family response regulator